MRNILYKLSIATIIFANIAYCTKKSADFFKNRTKSYARLVAVNSQTLFPSIRTGGYKLCVLRSSNV